MFIRTVARAAAVAVGASLLMAPTSAIAAEAQDFDGTTPYTAAGSCWEIKQRQPDAPDARYWVITPAMDAPMQVYCDQTSDGGGWTMVARGRERWTESGEGTGDDRWITELPVDGRNGTMLAKQLSGSQIDALLNNTRVDALADGVRLRRVKNTSGTAWQEIRYKLASRDRWTWALSAMHKVNSYTVDGRTSQASQTTRDMRINGGNDVNRIFTNEWAGNNYSRGFNYSQGGPIGSTSQTSYVYSSRSDGQYGTPFTQMFVRPKLLRSDLDFGGIANSGSPAVTQRPLVSSQAEPSVWGVKGLGSGGQNKDYATEVSAFAQIGNRMYVGGNFTKVRNNATGKEYSQPYLAAFNATTGAWISSFRPKLNNQVKALDVLHGRLLVGGAFTKVNGKTRRSLVVLGPYSGRTFSGFNTDFGQTTRGARLWVRSLVVNGNHVYVGGGFTRVKGGNRKSLIARYNLVRLRGTDGAPYPWAPNLGIGLVQSNGKRTARSSVLDLSMSPDRRTLYAAGQFTQGYVGADGKRPVSAPGAVALTVGTNAAFRSWKPVYSSTVTRSHYQQAVQAIDDKVWLGGSQHSLVEYKASNLSFIRGNLTLAGGDFQAIDSGSGIVYGSCHCEEFNYSNTMAYDGRTAAGATQADHIDLVGAWDSKTGDYLPEFAPDTGTRSGEGPWALKVASNGTLWAGGDFTSAVTTNGKNEWAGGFLRFARKPTAAPAKPANFEARYNEGSNFAYFSWSSSSTSSVSYELIKDNRVVQLIDARSGGTQYSATENYQLAAYSGRFFVRAVDKHGNRSATSPVVKIGGSAASAARAPEPDPPATEDTAVSAGSAWLVTAPNSGAIDDGWTAPGYSPTTAWSEATAPIGWGTAAAVSAFDAQPGTFYLRREFTIDDADSLTSVMIRTVADDGAAIYINGVEVGRKNLPGGTLDESVKATATPTGSGSLDWTISVPTSLLVSGRNVVSAEVHPGSSNTKDLLFDLQITVR